MAGRQPQPLLATLPGGGVWSEVNDAASPGPRSLTRFLLGVNIPANATDQPVAIVSNGVKMSEGDVYLLEAAGFFLSAATAAVLSLKTINCSVVANATPGTSLAIPTSGAIEVPILPPTLLTVQASTAMQIIVSSFSIPLVTFAEMLVLAGLAPQPSATFQVALSMSVANSSAGIVSLTGGMTSIERKLVGYKSQ